MIKELYNYRQLLKSNVRKEIRGKYKGSFLGVLWSFVNPLLTTLVYAIIFPFILKGGKDHYTTFIVIAILPWTFFTTSISQTNCILMQGQILKKVYFPRIILPLSVVLSTLVNFLISCLIILIFLFCSGIGFSWYILLLPLIVITQFILTLGILLITSSIGVIENDRSGVNIPIDYKVTNELMPDGVNDILLNSSIGISTTSSRVESSISFSSKLL